MPSRPPLPRPQDAESPLPAQDWSALTITNRCNQRCVFCYEGDRCDWREPTFSEVQSILTEVRQRSPFVVFCGAEALLRPDIVDVVRFSSSLGLRTGVFTNGQVLARDGFIEELVDAGLAGLQVSFHFPDPDSFARGTGLRPEHFGRLLEGLRHVRDYNLAHPQARLRITTETGLSTFNYMHLSGMRSLLVETLGTSFDSMRLGCIHPCGGFTTEPLLEPLEGRREELRSFLASHPSHIALSYSKVPLCLVPGWEHLSLEVAYRARGVTAFDNNQDYHVLEETNARIDELRRNPYRWLCKDCSLLPLCRVVRTDWRSPAFLPTRSQMPIPYRDVTPESVLARLLKPADPLPDLTALRLQAGAIAMPELELQRLVRSAVEPPAAVEFYHDRTPLLDFVVAGTAQPFGCKLAFPARGQDVGFLVQYLAALPHHPTSLPDEALAFLRRVSAQPIPSPDVWSHGPVRPDPRAVDDASLASSLIGEHLWPGSSIGAFRVERASLDATTGVSVLLRSPARARIELVVRRRGDAQDDSAALNAIESAQARIYVRSGPGATPLRPEDALPLARSVVHLLRQRLPRDLLPLSLPVRARRAAASARGLAVTFTPRASSSPDVPFIVRPASDGRIIIAHRPAIGGKLLRLCAAIIADVAAIVPLSSDSRGAAAWQTALTSRIARSALSRSLDCHVHGI